MWSPVIFFIILGLGVFGLVRGIRGTQRERKQLITIIIFSVGIFLFLVVLTPKFVPNGYDAGHVSGPAVVPAGDGLRMYFTGHTLAVNPGRNGKGSIGFAESDDGVTWAKRRGGAVLEPSLARFSDSGGVIEPAVVVVGDTWYMYYIAQSYKGTATVNLATSSDGVSWKRHPDNPILTPERPLPALDEVAQWTDEQVADFLTARGYGDDSFRISKRAWLTDILSLSQRLDDPGFFPNVRIKGLAVAQYVLAAGKVPDELVLDETLTIRRQDIAEAARTITRLFADVAGRQQPNWAEVAVMEGDEVDELVEALGVPDSAFEIDKREYLTTTLKIVDGEIGWAGALRYLKITGDASRNATHLSFYDTYRELKQKLTHGVDGDGFGDLAVVHDADAGLFRMWYVARGFKGSVLAYATSTDGADWKRASWTETSGLRELGAISAISVISDAAGYRAAVVQDGTIGLAHSPDAVIGWTIDQPAILSTGERDRWDSRGIVSVALHKHDGAHSLWYAAESRDADKPMPTLDDLEALSNKRVFKLAEIVGCRMSWDRDESRRFLSYANSFTEKRSKFIEIGFGPFERMLKVPAWDFEAKIKIAPKPLRLMVVPGAIYSFGDDLVREIIQRYNVEIEISDAEHLAQVDRRDVIWWTRKALLSRCLVKYGRSLKYPSAKEIDASSFDELVEACRRYGIGGIPPLPEPDAELSVEEQERLAAEFRDGLTLFSNLCAGKRRFLDSLSDERVVEIAVMNGIGVTLGGRDLRRNIGRIDPNVLRVKIEKDVQKRFANWLEKQPIVTRIGLATSGDGHTWTKIDGAKAYGAVLDARHRYEKARNPLQETVEGKVADYVVLLGWMAVFLGTVNLFRHHGRIVIRWRENWLFSLTFFVTFFGMLIFSALYHPSSVEFVPGPSPVHFADNFISNPLVATILALLGYYIVSAAYRAFRVKNIEATVMMIVAVLVMLGNVPAFEPLTRHGLLHTVFDQLHFPFLRDWIMSKGNAAVFRALNFGLAIGVVAMSIRIIFGIERGAFFEKL